MNVKSAENIQTCGIQIQTSSHPSYTVINELLQSKQWIPIEPPVDSWQNS